MKILMMIDSLVLGGRERRFTEVVKGLHAKGFRIEVILLRNAVDYPVIYDYADKVHILERKIKKDPGIFFKIYAIYMKFRPEIIHSWGSMCSVYALPVVIFTGVRLLNAMIADSSCRKYGKNWFRAKLTFPFSGIILSNSYAGLKAYGIEDLPKAHVIHNGYDFNRSPKPDTEALRRSIGIHTRYVVGMVAAFHIRRDYRTYLEAAVSLCRKNDAITFLCIGNGPTEDEHKAMVPPEFMDTRIKFLGFRSDVESIVHLLDLGVLLVNANLIQEGLSNAIVEYMAHAVPVIATNSGGSHEIVDEGVNGFFVEPYNVSELAEKIEILIWNDSLRLEMGQAGLRKIKNEFSYSHMIEGTIRLYRELLNK